MGWPTAKIGEVLSVDRQSVEPQEIVNGTLYVGLENITGDGSFAEVEPIQNGTLSSSKFSFGDRHVLFGKLRPYLRKTAKPKFSGICSTDILPLLPSEKLDRGYLYHTLRLPTFVEAATLRATGVNLPRISPKLLTEMEIPLPALPEQRRIAAILDKADALRQKRREAIAKLDQLLQSVFLEMFGDPVTNTKGLPTTSLGEACYFFAGNSLPDYSPFVGQADGTLALKVSDMNAEGNEIQIKVTAGWVSSSSAKGVKCPSGAIVFPKRGGAIATNKKRLLARDAYLDPNLMGVAPKNTMLRAEYLYVWFQRFTLQEITSGTSVPQLNKRDLAPLRIPVPPMELQDQLAEVARRLESQKSLMGSGLNYSSVLFAALQQRAFTGQL